MLYRYIEDLDLYTFSEVALLRNYFHPLYGEVELC